MVQTSLSVYNSNTQAVKPQIRSHDYIIKWFTETYHSAFTDGFEDRPKDLLEQMKVAHILGTTAVKIQSAYCLNELPEGFDITPEYYKFIYKQLINLCFACKKFKPENVFKGVCSVAAMTLNGLQTSQTYNHYFREGHQFNSNEIYNINDSYMQVFPDGMGEDEQILARGINLFVNGKNAEALNLLVSLIARCYSTQTRRLEEFRLKPGESTFFIEG